MDIRASDPASFDMEPTEEGFCLAARGDWVIANLDLVDDELRALTGLAGRELVVDFERVSRLDTAGAFVLHRTLREVENARASSGFVHVSEDYRILLDEVAANDKPCEEERAPRNSLLMVLDRIGETVEHSFQQASSILNLCGEVVVNIGQTIWNPRRLRVMSLVHHMEQAGLDAVPIVSLLTFLIGAVVAFLGASILRTFGAEIFTVELVAYAVLRELGVLLTAIILAGRSGSAFTAQIGSMKVNEEIDAMRTLGLDPVEVLVTPRILAFLIMLPILSFIGDIMGLFGGILIAWAQLDISPGAFLIRVNENIPINHFWAGMIKAPFFAFVIALLGCHEGLKVEGSAESVGRHTTLSVVQAIFSVIVIDALFAIFYIEVDF